MLVLHLDYFGPVIFVFGSSLGLDSFVLEQGCGIGLGWTRLELSLIAKAQEHQPMLSWIIYAFIIYQNVEFTKIWA